MAHGLTGQEPGRREVPVGDSATGVVDLHALRACFATMLARTGAPLVLAQRLLAVAALPLEAVRSCALLLATRSTSLH